MTRVDHVFDALERHSQLMNVVLYLKIENIRGAVLALRDIPSDVRDEVAVDLIFQALHLNRKNLDAYCELCSVLSNEFGIPFREELGKQSLIRTLRIIKHEFFGEKEFIRLSCDLEFVSGLISRDIFPFDPFVKFIERNLEKNKDYAALVIPFLSVFSSRLAVSNLALHSRLMDHYKSNGASSEDLVSRFPVDSENGNDDDRMILEPWRTDDVEAFQTLLSQTPKDHRAVELLEKCIKFHATQCIKLLLMDSDYDFLFSRKYYLVTLSTAAISAGDTEFLRHLEERGVKLSASRYSRKGSGFNADDATLGLSDYQRLAAQAIISHRLEIYNWIVGTDHQVSFAEMKHCMESCNSELLIAYKDQWMKLLQDLKEGQIQEALVLCIRNDFVEGAALCLSYLKNVDAIEEKILRMCALRERRGFVRVLCECGNIDVTHPMCRVTGACLSHYFSKKGDLGLLELLCEFHVSSLCCVTCSGHSALDFARCSKCDECIVFLERFLKDRKPRDGELHLFPKHLFGMMGYELSCDGIMRVDASSFWTEFLWPQEFEITCFCHKNIPLFSEEIMSLPNGSVVELSYFLDEDEFLGCDIRDPTCEELFKQVPVTTPFVS